MLNGIIVLFRTIKYWKHIWKLYTCLLQEFTVRIEGHFLFFTIYQYVWMHDFFSAEGMIQEKALRVYRLGDVMYFL